MPGSVPHVRSPGLRSKSKVKQGFHAQHCRSVKGPRNRAAQARTKRPGPALQVTCTCWGCPPAGATTPAAGHVMDFGEPPAHMPPLQPPACPIARPSTHGPDPPWPGGARHPLPRMPATKPRPRVCDPPCPPLGTAESTTLQKSLQQHYTAESTTHAGFARLRPTLSSTWDCCSFLRRAMAWSSRCRLMPRTALEAGACGGQWAGGGVWWRGRLDAGAGGHPRARLPVAASDEPTPVPTSPAAHRVKGGRILVDFGRKSAVLRPHGASSRPPVGSPQEAKPPGPLHPVSPLPLLGTHRPPALSVPA